MLFFLLYFKVAEKWRLPIVGALSLGGTVMLFIAPNTLFQILSYFILWWCGAELAKAYDQEGWPSWRSQAPSLGVLILCLAIRTPRGALQSFSKGAHGYHPFVEFWNLSAGLVLILVALLLGRAGCRALAKVIAPFAWIAPCSYGLYVVHGPLVFHGDWLGFIPFTVVKVVLYIGVALGLAWLAEGPYQRFISARILRLIRKNPVEPASVPA